LQIDLKGFISKSPLHTIYPWQKNLVQLADLGLDTAALPDAEYLKSKPSCALIMPAPNVEHPSPSTVWALESGNAGEKIVIIDLQEALIDLLHQVVCLAVVQSPVLKLKLLKKHYFSQQSRPILQQRLKNSGIQMFPL
tara:strand:- start:132 stop:545 length:414 start_codon:yes stop_codon:yes gene_type:complete